MEIGVKILLHGAEGIRKSRPLLEIPSGLLNRQLILAGMDIGEQGDDREEAEQSRCDAQNGKISPLALGLHAEMSSSLVEGDFHLPAPWKPLNNFLGGDGEIRAQQGLRLEPLLRIADDDPADGQSRFADMKPHCGAGREFDLAFLFAIPFMNGELFPLRALVFGNLLKCRQTLTFFARAASLPQGVFGGRIESRIHVKANNHGHRVFELAQLPKQLNHGKTAVGHHDQLAFRQPSASLKDPLTSPFRKLFMPANFALIIPLRRRQDRQERQGPGASSPRDRRQQHQAEPAQTTGFDKMSMRRSNWIAIDSFGFDLRSSSPFDRIVQAHNHWTPPSKRIDQKSQQYPTGFYARPLCPIEHTMIILKMLLHTQAHHAQSCGNSSFGGRKDRTHHQELCMFPNPIRKQIRKGSQDHDIVVLQGMHRLPLVQELALAYPAFC